MRVKSCYAAETPTSSCLTRLFARLDEPGDSSLAAEKADAAAVATEDAAPEAESHSEAGQESRSGQTCLCSQAGRANELQAAGVYKPVLEKAGRSPSGFLVPLNRTENRCPSLFMPPSLNSRPSRRRGPPSRKGDILWRELPFLRLAA